MIANPMRHATLSLLAISTLLLNSALPSAHAQVAQDPAEYRVPIEALKVGGIISEESAQSPTELITRAEAITMVVRAFPDVKAYLKSNDMQPDVLNGIRDHVTNQWFTPYVAAAVESDLLTGYADSTLRPLQLITAGEGLSMISKTFDDTTGDPVAFAYSKNLIREGANLESAMALNRGEFATIIYRTRVVQTQGLERFPSPPNPEEENDTTDSSGTAQRIEAREPGVLGPVPSVLSLASNPPDSIYQPLLPRGSTSFGTSPLAGEFGGVDYQPRWFGSLATAEPLEERLYIQQSSSSPSQHSTTSQPSRTTAHLSNQPLYQPRYQVHSRSAIATPSYTVQPRQQAPSSASNLFRSSNTGQFTARANISSVVRPEGSRRQFSISIPKLGIQNLRVTHPDDASTSEGQLAVLQEGVGHLFHYPGSQGTVMVYGHSSSYPWDISEFTKIFRRINELETGDTVQVHFGGTVHTYRVTREKTIPASDVSFVQDSKEELVLYTCWPPESVAERYVVFAERI